jgi:two-component system, cell cycle sensor histidine kinase and response regulator CckA
VRRRACFSCGTCPSERPWKPSWSKLRRWRRSGGYRAVSHDFNNILTVVVASTSLAREALHPSHPALAEVATIEEAAARATGLVSQLLAFARTQPVSPTAFDLNQLVVDLGGMLKRLVRENVQIRTILDPEPVPVFADHGQIDQVVMNLVVNACDAMAQGGALTLQTIRERRADDAPHLPSRGVLLVSDEGCGLAPEVKARIFEPFFTTKPAGSGTGLGLSSCYGIVTRAGGRIDVTSVVGQGTTFRVTLPGADAVAAQARESSKPPASACVERILLVEDEALVRRLAARSLRAHGYEVLEADGGGSALELLQQAETLPALLVTDVAMPGLDGPSLATLVRALHPDLPVLFITGYGEHVLAKSGMWADAEILKKPFSPAALCERVRRMLDSHAYVCSSVTKGKYPPSRDGLI